MAVIVVVIICILFVILHSINGDLKNKRQAQDCLDKCICPNCKSKLEKTTEFIPAHSEWWGIESMDVWVYDSYKTTYKCKNCGYEK